MIQRIHARIFILFIVSVVFVSCQNKKNDTLGSVPEAFIEEAGSLPLSSAPIVLKMFVEMDQGKIGVHTASYADMLCFQELAKQTNVTIDFIHPPAGLAAEQLNLMMAAADMPDITYWNWNRVPGGPAKAMADNIIMPLNDYIKSLPYYNKFLSDNLVVDKDVKTDEGIYYCFPCIQKSEDFKSVFGFMIRKDWLDKLGLPMPETLDELYNTLVAFRDQDPNGNGKKDEIPMASMYAKGFEDLGTDAVRALYAVWGKYDSIYVNNGKVYMGAYEPEYKDYLLAMRKWIEEGLIDSNFSTVDTVQVDAAMLNGISGVCRDGLAAGLDKFYTNFKSDNTVVGMPFPRLAGEGMSYNFMNIGKDFNGSGAALSPKGRNNAIAAKWLDYLYSDDATIVLNFGVEGQTFNWVDGYPRVVDSIANNPQESINVALGRYAIGVTGFCFINDVRVREQRMLKTKTQIDTLALWNKSDIRRALPAVTFTAEESQELSNILSEANTFIKEYTLGFLLGRRDINRDFDGYINTLKSMGIEKVIAVNQAAVDRYNKR
jgi:putative aldouronate transport system substrate-binding protein